MAPTAGPTAARARSPLPKQRIPPPPDSSLLPPLSLDRASSSSLNRVSKPIGSGAAPRSTAGPSSARRGPRFLACHICSRPFAAASLPIHVPQCLEKWRLEQAKLPKELRAKAEPAEKPIVPSAGGVVDVDEWNRAAEEQARAAMPACTHCGRKFNPDRISKHESVCEKNKSKTSTTVTTGLDSGKSARSLANDTARRAQAHDAITQQNKVSNATYKAVDSSKKPMKMCMICNREFGSKSIGLHIPACAKKYVLEQDRSQVAAGQRRTVEELIELATRAVAAASAPAKARAANPFDETAIRPADPAPAAAAADRTAPGDVDLRQQCPNCPRKFNPDRLPVHLRSCKSET